MAFADLGITGPNASGHFHPLKLKWEIELVSNESCCLRTGVSALNCSGEFVRSFIKVRNPCHTRFPRSSCHLRQPALRCPGLHARPIRGDAYVVDSNARHTRLLGKHEASWERRTSGPSLLQSSTAVDALIRCALVTCSGKQHGILRVLTAPERLSGRRLPGSVEGIQFPTSTVPCQVGFQF